MTSMTNLASDMYKKDGDMKTKATNFFHKREINDTRSTKNSSSRNRERETHHRYSFDLSSSNAKTSFQNTTNGNNCPTIARKQSSNKSNSSKNRKVSPISASHKESKYVDYENLLKQFKKLRLKAELFADKDPEFAAKLINIANKITKSVPKMDSSFYPNNFYQRSSAYSSHSNYPSSNIYSTFNSGHFNQYSHHYPSSQHNHTPPTNPPPPPPPRPPPIPPHSHRNSSNSKYPSENSNGYFNNNNFSSFSFENSHYLNNLNFTRKPTANSQPSQTNNFDHNIYTQFFSYNYPNHDNSFKYSYSFPNDKPEDLLLILEDPYDSNKITVQMTRTQVGPGGEQQRVTIERDFKSEIELNKFLKEFEENLNKTSSSIPSNTKTTSFSNFFGPNQQSESEDNFKPGVVVIEEPGEEPILYRQDTGEFVKNQLLKDQFKTTLNNKQPDEEPIIINEKSPKFYQDIDNIFKCEESHSINSSKIIDIDKSSLSSCCPSQNITTSRDLINFDDDFCLEPKSEPNNSKPEPIRRTVRRTESFVIPKVPKLSKSSLQTDPNQKIHFRSSSTSSRKPQVSQPNEKPPLIKKQINTDPPKPTHLTEKSKIKVLNINKNPKLPGSISENLNSIQPDKPVRPEVAKKETLDQDQIKQGTKFKHQFDKPVLSNHAKLGGEPAVTLRRHTSLLEKNSSYEKKSLNISVSGSEPVMPKSKKSEIKSRFSLRETRPNVKDYSRRYSQIYHKRSDSDISIIHEEKKDEEADFEKSEKILDDKKHKFIKNHRLMMSKKLSKSVDTGLSDNGTKYMKMKKIEEKISQQKRNKIGSQTNFYQDTNSDIDEYDSENAGYGDNSIKTSSQQLNYDYYSYDQSYSEGYYNYYNTVQTPAYFQPDFFNKSKSRIHEPEINPQISVSSQPTQAQISQTQTLYYPNYYTSWYGSAPSLRIQNQRIDNSQSIYFN